MSRQYHDINDLARDVSKAILNSSEDSDLGVKISSWPPPPASSIGRGLVFFPTLGTKGSLWYSDGTNITPIANTTYSAINGILIPTLSSSNSATYSRAAGATTAGKVTVVNGGASPIAHNIPATENGKSIILLGNTGALSTTAKIYTNFLWISNTSFSCWDTVTTATSGTLKTNLAITLAHTLTIPANSLGTLGILESWFISHNNSSPGIKNLYVDFGNALNVICSSSRTTVTDSLLIGNKITQINNNNQYLSTGTKFTVDTTLDQLLSIRAQCDTANDYIAIDSYVVNIQKIG